MLRCTLSLFRGAVAFGVALAVVMALFTATGAQVIPAAPKRAPIKPISSIDGKDLYKAYCSQCHGATGKGDGPAAAGLKAPPADLTQLAAKNGGKFNRKGVEVFIKGDRPGGVMRSDSHGNPIIMTPAGPDEMPVWGIIFRYVWPDEPVTIRCGNLARYIETLQAKSYDD